MAILVSDTSVIIDLDRGTLLEDLFRLPHEFAVPDVLFERELSGPLGTRLVELGLRVEELSPAEVSRATSVRRERAALSVPDTFAFAIAEGRGWPLLSGDGGLRRLAATTGVACHGVLWICDQLEDGQHVPAAQLRASLSAIAAHPRCRLPVAEIRLRLERYGF